MCTYVYYVHVCTTIDTLLKSIYGTTVHVWYRSGKNIWRIASCDWLANLLILTVGCIIIYVYQTSDATGFTFVSDRLN